TKRPAPTIVIITARLRLRLLFPMARHSWQAGRGPAVRYRRRLRESRATPRSPAVASGPRQFRPSGWPARARRRSAHGALEERTWRGRCAHSGRLPMPGPEPGNARSGMPYDDVIATTFRSSQDRRLGRRILETGRVGCLAAALALAAAPAAFGADPPHGSHGEETDAPAVTTATTYSRAVGQICAGAVLFEQPHRIGTRAGALAVASDIRATSRRRLALVATVQPAPRQEAMAVRWQAVEQRL